MPKRRRIMITGAEGALGQELAKAFWDAGWVVTCLSRTDCDITDRDAVFDIVEDLAPDAIVNAAAYNAVDKAEESDEEHARARAINVDGPANLAAAAADAGIPFVHYSTDYVFSGEKDGAYTEDDVPDPVNRYGATKADGEQAVQDIGGRSYIVRVARLFGRASRSASAKPTFVSVMRRLGREKPEIRIVHEEPGMPVATEDVAHATARLLADERPPGIYHFVNDGEPVTWYEFAEEVFALEPTSARRIPVRGAEMGARPAKRPARIRLASTKVPLLRPRTEALRHFLTLPEVSVVIVTHNASRFIGDNIARLFSMQDAPSMEVIVVDNASTDGTPELVRQRFPQVTVIRNAYNSGFGHACNQGYAISRGDTVIFLNPDMQVDEGAIAHTHRTLHARPEIGVMGIRLRNAQGATVRSVRRDPGFGDQLAILCKVPHLFPRVLDRYLARDMDHEASGEVDSVRGSYFAMRRDMLAKVGPFDEDNFFIWFEEVDLCRRVREAGHVVWYDTSVSALDLVGATFRTQPTLQKQRWFTRSMARYFRKWHPRWQAAMIMAVRPLALAMAAAADLFRVRRGEPPRT